MPSNSTSQQCTTAAHLPQGVRALPLSTHDDGRGSLTELYNDRWNLGLGLAQWNFVRSNAGVLRGLHVHERHTDYICVPEGKMLLGLQDFRRSSDTFGVAGLHELSFDAPKVWIIPPGVGHAFYFPVDSIHIYGLTEPWANDGGLGCRFDAEGITIPWPEPKPLLSPRDEAAMTLTELLTVLERSENAQ